MIWGTIIAWYLFLAGLGAGAFVTSALLERLYPQALRTRKLGRYICPLVIAIGLALLIIDARAGLFHPWRFLLLISNEHSVMSWGVVFLSIFMVISLLVAAAELLRISVPRWLVNVGVLFALAVATYTGVLLGVVKTFPLWNNALLPILFLVSALSSGAAATLLMGYLFAPQELKGTEFLGKLHLCFPIFELLLIASLFFITSYNSEAGANSVHSIIGGRYAVHFWLGLICVGLLIPIIIETMHLRKTAPQRVAVVQEPVTPTSGVAIKTQHEGHHVGQILGESFVLIGGFLLRYLVVIAALPITIVTPVL